MCGCCLFFLQKAYHASVQENAPQGTFVTKVKATDIDAGDFGLVFYSLLGERSSDFNINEKVSESFSNLTRIPQSSTAWRHREMWLKSHLEEYVSWTTALYGRRITWSPVFHFSDCKFGNLGSTRPRGLFRLFFTGRNQSGGNGQLGSRAYAVHHHSSCCHRHGEGQDHSKICVSARK